MVGSLVVTTEETVCWGEVDRIIPSGTVLVVIDGKNHEVATGLYALQVFHADFGSCFCLQADLKPMQNNQ